MSKAAPPAPFTIAASVGAHQHPFDRFVDWLEPWVEANGADVVFQHGASRPIRGAENHATLTTDRLLSLYKSVDVVVIEGGSESVVEARKAGRLPIVVSRQHTHGEAADDHQVALTRQLADMGLVYVADSPGSLRALLDGVRTGTVPTRATSRKPTAGVDRAVQMLSELPLGSASRSSARAPVGPPPVSPLRTIQNGQRARVPADRMRRPRDVASRIGDAVHHGLLGYLAAFVLAVVAAVVVGLEGAPFVGTMLAVGAWLGYSYMALPGFERARSPRPLLRLVWVLGAALVVLVVAGIDLPSWSREALIVVSAAAAGLALSAVAHRVLLRRVRTVIVGQDAAVRKLGTRWQARDDLEVVAMCGWPASAELVPMNSPSSLGNVVPEVLSLVRRHRARRVVMATDRALATPALRYLAWALRNADVECLVLTDMNEHVEYLRPRKVGDQIALAMRPPNDHLMSVAIKSAFDRVSAAIGLLVLSPLLLAIALAIGLTSRGPVLFRQTRSGRDGEPFTIYKFRTMVVDAEERLADLMEHNEGAGPLFKLQHDPRITGVGRFLRSTSLDELPQLINVVLGSMSLVGPRPALPAETEQYSEWVWRRLHVKPGITGLWQVSGRSRLSWEDSIKVDLQYVNNWNLRLDLAILLKTFRAVLARDGAM